MLHTRVCDLLGITHPIVLGGMGGGTSPELLAAVSNAGGLGIMGVTGRRPEEFGDLVSRIRAQTAKPFGLNFLLFRADERAIEAALAQRPPVLSYAWAWPDQDLAGYVRRAHQAGSRVIYMVSDLPEARRAAAAGADVIVAQGTEGGGHVGLIGTMILVPQVVSAVAPAPVLAAGGIADGRGLAAALALGAEGVLVGTRFLATEEGPIPESFKAAIIASDGHDTTLTEIPDLASGTVWPGAFARAWRNAFIEEWCGREGALRRDRAAAARQIAEARANGDARHASLLFGQDAGLIDSILPAAEVVHRMAREATAILGERLPEMILRS